MSTCTAQLTAHGKPPLVNTLFLAVITAAIALISIKYLRYWTDLLTALLAETPEVAGKYVGSFLPILAICNASLSIGLVGIIYYYAAKQMLGFRCHFSPKTYEPYGYIWIRPEEMMRATAAIAIGVSLIVIVTCNTIMVVFTILSAYSASLGNSERPPVALVSTQY